VGPADLSRPAEQIRRLIAAACFRYIDIYDEWLVGGTSHQA
jgi:hypothetical protein